MLFHLAVYLREQEPWLSWLNVVRYTSFRWIAAALTALLVSMVFGPAFIRWLAARQLGEVIRDDGPQSHARKGGTPTMGGALILASLIGSTLLWCDLTNPYVWLALAVLGGYGALGFVDDWLKLRARGKGRRGLPGKVKLAAQVAIASGVVGAMLALELWPEPVAARLALPLVDFYRSDLALPLWLYGAFGVLVIVASSNAVNLTDGLDGLAIGPVIVCAVTLGILSYAQGTVLRGFNIAQYLRVPHLPGVGELAPLCGGALFAAGVGFLWYNAPPASVFMGDVGSLPLGATLGFVAVATKNEVVWAILGGLFVMEAASVMVQVVSFKLTGRRVFRMAPLHHHFELIGWPESKIVVRAWIVSFLLALVALATLKLR